MILSIERRAILCASTVKISTILTSNIKCKSNAQYSRVVLIITRRPVIVNSHFECESAAN